MTTISFTDLEINLDFAWSYYHKPTVSTYAEAIKDEYLYDKFVAITLNENNKVHFTIDRIYKRGKADVSEFPYAPQPVHNLFDSITD